MGRFFHLIDLVNDRLGVWLSYCNFLVVGIVCYEVIARYVFNSPTDWASDGMVMLSGFVYCLAGGYAQLHKRHVRVDILYSRLGPKGQAACDLLGYGAFCLLMYALVVNGGKFAWASIKIRETAGTPWDPVVYPVKAAIPVAAALLWLQMTAEVIRTVARAFWAKEA